MPKNHRRDSSLAIYAADTGVREVSTLCLKPKEFPQQLLKRKQPLIHLCMHLICLRLQQALWWDRTWHSLVKCINKYMAELKETRPLWLLLWAYQKHNIRPTGQYQPPLCLGSPGEFKYSFFGVFQSSNAYVTQQVGLTAVDSEVSVGVESNSLTPACSSHTACHTH